MLLEGGGNITVSYILTVPYIEGAGGELVPIVPLADVEPSDGERFFYIGVACEGACKRKPQTLNPTNGKGAPPRRGILNLKNEPAAPV